MATRTVRAEARTTIRRPMAAVFDWLTDPALLPQWVTGLVATRPDGSAALRVGARSVEEVLVRGKTIPMPAEIVEVDLGRVIASRIETPDGPLLSRFELGDRGGACGVTHTLTAEFDGHRWMPSPVIVAAMRRQMRGDLARLKQLVETES